jgi:hypothetical protein
MKSLSFFIFDLVPYLVKKQIQYEMKKIRFIVTMLFFTSPLFAQTGSEVFKKGEHLKYRIYYGIINAGYASFDVNEKNTEKDSLYHFKGKGWTTGMTKWFFNVKDTYESFVDKESQFPRYFKRRVNEGGYIINRDIYFDPLEKTAKIEDHKNKTVKEVPVEKVHDMISAIYHLRSQNIEDLVIGESLELNMFFDAETFPFKLKYLGTQILKTRFGKIKCFKLRPLVQSGRVFEEEESLTIWVSSDKNRIPVRVKASLAIGALKVDLYQYKGLSHPFRIIL